MFYHHRQPFLLFVPPSLPIRKLRACLISDIHILLYVLLQNTEYLNIHTSSLLPHFSNLFCIILLSSYISLAYFITGLILSIFIVKHFHQPFLSSPDFFYVQFNWCCICVHFPLHLHVLCSLLIHFCIIKINFQRN